MIRYDFKNKVVLVTGSSRGMGATMLERFVQAGATGLVHFFEDPSGENRRDAEGLGAKLRSAGGSVHILEADVRHFDAVERLMKDAIAATGRLDVLVNNAGILRDRTIRKMSLDEWHSVLETN